MRTNVSPADASPRSPSQIALSSPPDLARAGAAERGETSADEQCPRCGAIGGHLARCSRKPIVLRHSPAPVYPVREATRTGRPIYDGAGYHVGYAVDGRETPVSREVTARDERVTGPEGR